jgi:Trypsin-co-occurring domain 1
MASRYIELKDRIIVEVGSPGEGRVEMNSAILDQVDFSMKQVGDIVDRIVRPIGESFRDMQKAVDVPIEVEKAEVEIGLSFSAEGNIFITKAKTEGSLSVKIVFVPVKPRKG